jgi:hypothetical protein
MTPQWLQNGVYPAGADRRLISAIWPQAMVSGLAVSAGAGMAVNVAAGQAVVPTPNNTGATLCTSDAVEVVALPVAPASGLNRIDVVTVHPRGNDLDGGASDDWILDVISSAAVASPVAPAVPAGQVALAQVYVAGGVASIVAGNITDARPTVVLRPWNAAWGVVAPPLTSAANGTPSPGAETKDAVLGDYVFRAVAGRRYRVVFQNELANGGAGDVWQLRVRDGGAASPVVASTLVAEYWLYIGAAGSLGRLSSNFAVDIGALAAGVHTFGRFNLRNAGSGTYTGVISSAPLLRELFVEDIGPITPA